MTGVRTGPPMIDIPKREPPIFVLGPRPRRPSAKMVGNMTDMKKLVRKMAQRPIHPGKAIANATNTLLDIA